MPITFFTSNHSKMMRTKLTVRQLSSRDKSIPFKDINNIMKAFVSEQTKPLYFRSVAIEPSIQDLQNFIADNNLELSPTTSTLLSKYAADGYTEAKTLMSKLVTNRHMKTQVNKRIKVLASRCPGIQINDLRIHTRKDIKHTDNYKFISTIYSQLLNQAPIHEYPTIDLIHGILNIISNEAPSTTFQNSFLLTLYNELGFHRFCVNIIHLTNNLDRDIIYSALLTNYQLATSDIERNMWINLAIYTLQFDLPNSFYSHHTSHFHHPITH